MLLSTVILQWLFFVRLFADLTGRLLPRVKRLALGSQEAVLALGLLMLALTPLFYLYIALAPPWLISDALACGRAQGGLDYFCRRMFCPVYFMSCPDVFCL